MKYLEFAAFFLTLCACSFLSGEEYQEVKISKMDEIEDYTEIISDQFLMIKFQFHSLEHQLNMLEDNLGALRNSIKDFEFQEYQVEG